LAWMGWLHVVLPRATGPSKATGVFAWPLAGWVGADGPALALGSLSAAVLVLALTRLRSDDRHVGVFLALTLAMSTVLSSEVTGSWVDASRLAAPAIPLAVWLHLRSSPPERGTISTSAGTRVAAAFSVRPRPSALGAAP